MTARARAMLAVAVVVLVVAFGYRDALRGDFVYDDVPLIVDNALLHRPFDLAAVLGSAFWQHTPQPSGTYYRPLVIASFAVDAGLAGFRPAMFHLTNLLLHLVNTVLVAALAWSLCRRWAVAATVALLFGVHPLNSEAVLWVSARSDLLAACFGLTALALLAGAGNRSVAGRRASLAASAVALFLALLSKESAVALLPVLVASVLVGLPAAPRGLASLLPHALAVVAYTALRLAVLGAPAPDLVDFVFNPLVNEGAGVRLWNALALFGRYVGKLVVPATLSVDYSFDSIPVAHSLFEASAIAGLASLVALLGLAWVSRRRAPSIVLGVVFLLASSAVTLGGAVATGAAMFGERYAYLASAGFAITVAVTVATWLAPRLPATSHRPIAAVALALVAAACLARLASRVPEWRDDAALFASVVAVFPRNAIAHNYLGVQYAARGQIAPARAHCARALEIYPDYPHPLLCLGRIALDAGAPADAVRYLTRAAQRWPRSDAPLLLGDAYVAMGRLEQARETLREGGRSNPGRARYLTSLGNVTMRMGQADQAVQAWQEAVRIDPGEMAAVASLAHHHELKGDLDRARAYYRRLLDADPPGFEVYKARARRLLGAPAR